MAITHQGVETALKIQRGLDISGYSCTVYAPKKFSQNGVVSFDTKLADFISGIYSKADGIVAVMASGVIIRSVAPILESKLTDPAVVGVDAMGKFAVSLLSGHLGGANDLANTVAKIINAIPVVTTATEVMGKQSVEELSKNLHLVIENSDSLVAVNSAIVNGDRVVLVVVGDAKIPPNAIGAFEVRTVKGGAKALEVIDRYDAGIVITHEPLSVTNFTKPFTILKTRHVVVGLGATKEAPADNIITAVDAALEKVHVPLSRVYRFATVDIKRDSQPMLEAVEKLGAPLEFLSVEALRCVNYEDLSPDSAMVQEKIGIGGVCERAALLVAGKDSKLILKKMKLNGVTVAVAEG